MTLEFYADFTFYVRDYVDGDEVTIGSSNASREIQIPIEATISAEYDDGAEDVGNVEVVIGSKAIEVDFGYIDPFAGEDPTFEKY